MANEGTIDVNVLIINEFQIYLFDSRYVAKIISNFPDLNMLYKYDIILLLQNLKVEAQTFGLMNDNCKFLLFSWCNINVGKN